MLITLEAQINFIETEYFLNIKNIKYLYKLISALNDIDHPTIDQEMVNYFID